MDIVIIFNGLGNQMSQYAFYLAKKQRTPRCKVMFDISSKDNHNGLELEQLFGIKLNRSITMDLINFVFRVIRRFRLTRFVRLLGIKIIYEPLSYTFDSNNLNNKNVPISIFIGGWHSEKYFKSMQKQLQALYQFPNVDENTQEGREYNQWLKIIKEDEISVSLHIRRGDYLTESSDSPYQYYICPMEYYLEAIQYFLRNYKNPNFYVFSNDIEWCKNNIKAQNLNFINCNSGKNSWRDMSLMTQCRHHIVANSSFSWWGAWLSPHNGVTIRPKRFLNNHDTPDYYPQSWITL